MPLQFLADYTQSEKDIRTRTRAFVKKNIRATALEDDAASCFRREYFTEFAKLGFTGLTIPKKYMGQGRSYLEFYIMQEELARGSAAFSIATGVTAFPVGALLTFGTQAQKDMWLPKLASGKWLGAFSLSEPGSGTDAAALRLSAKKVQGGYRLSGTKMWCSNAGAADCYLVIARTSGEQYEGITAFIVLKDSVGFRAGKLEKKMGLRASTLGELIFEDCFIPENHRIAKEGQGFEVALSQLDLGRITIGCVGLGVAIEALERGMTLLLEKERSDKRACKDDLAMLADHYATAQSIRLLIREAARLKDQNQPLTLLASQIKLMASDLAVKASQDVMVLVGEAAYQREIGLERLLRDAKALQIVEGTNQIQRWVIAKELEKMLKEEVK